MKKAYLNKFFIGSLFFINFITCTTPKYLKVYQGLVFGTSYQIQYYTSLPDIDFQPKWDSIFEVFNKEFSIYDTNSVISHINANKSVIISSFFKDFWEQSCQLNKFTEGYFDPSIGYFINKYGFGKDTTNKIDSRKIDSNLFLWKKYSGIDKIQIVGTGYIKKQALLELNFNAIAKGYALDIIGYFLEAQNIKNYLIEIGGEILVKGQQLTKKQAWRVGIQSPYLKDNNISTVLSLKDIAMATSGNYRKFKTAINGDTIVHIIHPKTASAKETTIISASVFNPSCAVADALATAFIAMGFEKAKIFIEKNKIDVYLIYKDLYSQKQKFYITEGVKKMILH